MDLDDIEDNFEEDEELITSQKVRMLQNGTRTKLIEINVILLKVLENLEIAWLNEKSAPDILPYQGEMVELMLGQLTHMEENLQAVNQNDFRIITHKMELERIRYIIVNYLRCRLQKIEEYTQHFINEESNRSENEKKLSEDELIFAKEYFDSIEKHFQLLALRHIPAGQQEEDVKRLIRPNLMSFVFVKAKKDCGVVVNTNDQEVDLKENSQHLLPYQLIQDLVLKGNLQLL